LGELNRNRTLGPLTKETLLVTHKISRSFAALGVLSLCIAGMSPDARAGLSVSASVGGAPTGLYYANFDNLPLDATGGSSNGIGVSFTGSGQAVQGSASGLYAAPYLSGGNGTLFGDTTNGPDATTYLTTGIGTVTLTMPGQETYLGLLWGSVDSYNTLTFYEGSNVIGTVTSSQVTSNADGDQGVNGTYYVNITSTQSFDKVVASSTQYAFEFDNVAYNAVPEPSSFVLGLAGMAGVAACWRVRRKRPAPAAKA
jgi:hypothetical protein